MAIASSAASAVSMTSGSAPSVARRRSAVPGTAEAGEALAALREVPVAEGVPGDERLRGPRATAQDPEALAEEDLAVLGVGESNEPGVGREIARRPLPDVAQHLMAAEEADAARVGADGRGREGVLIEVGQL